MKYYHAVFDLLGMNERGEVLLLVCTHFHVASDERCSNLHMFMIPVDDISTVEATFVVQWSATPATSTTTTTTTITALQNDYYRLVTTSHPWVLLRWQKKLSEASGVDVADERE
jgi:hypothetical protein